MPLIDVDASLAIDGPKSEPVQRDGAMFRELHERHAQFVWRVVRRLGVPRADAEDITQEVFLVVHRKLETFEHRSSMRTWLYSIAYRVASDYRRRAHVRRELPTEVIDLGSVAATQPREVDEARARDMLDSILEKLDAEKRAVFVFFELEELSMAEVAAVLDCPLQTAYSRLYAAREHVAAHAERLAAQETMRQDMKR